MYPSEYWLRHAQNDFWYQHQMPITYRALDQLCGYKRGMFDAEAEESAWRRLDHFLPDIESRRVIFQKGRFFVTDGIPSITKKISPVWSLHAICHCGGNKFLPVMIEREYSICYQCIPPEQYKTLGGKLIKKSYIDEYIKNTYSTACP